MSLEEFWNLESAAWQLLTLFAPIHSEGIFTRIPYIVSCLGVESADIIYCVNESETRCAVRLSIYGNGPIEEVYRIKPRPLTNARRVWVSVLGEADGHQPITAITPAKDGIRSSRQPLGTAN
jgi:hypothetical protein